MISYFSKNDRFRVSSRRRRASLLLLPTLALITSSAWADGWTNPFTITSLYVSGPNNYSYRVYGLTSGAGTACGGLNWAYLNQGDAGAAWYASAILTAYAAGKQINLNVQTDPNGYCHIIEMNVQG